MEQYESYLESEQERFLSDLLTLYAIPSISALPEHAPDVRRAAEWVNNRLLAAGMENVQTLETGGHPVVYADWLHAPDRPTVMIYAHFDTQPVDPIELWVHPPFEPYCDGVGSMRAAPRTIRARLWSSSPPWRLCWLRAGRSR